MTDWYEHEHALAMSHGEPALLAEPTWTLTNSEQ